MAVTGNLGGIKAAIVTALETVTTLNRVYDHLPASINETPCAYVMPKSGNFHMDAGTNMTHRLEVCVLLKRIGDVEEAQENLDDYLDASGTIAAAIEGATLGTYAHALMVEGYHDYGGYEFPAGSQQYFIGVRFDILVIA
jgi:hypothetical protein